MSLNDNDSVTIPENDPSKAMDSKQEVDESPDNKIDQDFPGYPNSPATEEMMGKSTGSHRVDAGVAETGTGSNSSGVSQRYPEGQGGDRGKIDPLEKSDTENKEALQGRNAEVGVPQNVSNEDLTQNKDLPGTDVKEAADKGSTNP